MHYRPHPRYRPAVAGFAAVFFALILIPSVDAQPEFDDAATGLVGRYTADGHSVERVDSVISFDWGDATPDERLRPGEFAAEWTGTLLIRHSGQHTFHVFLAGEAAVSIDGSTVLQASEQWGFASGQPVSLRPGDHEIVVKYQTPRESDKPRARLALYWSSDQFTLEPVPADVLSRDESSGVDREAHGRKLADALRCAACHGNRAGDMPLKAPSLDRVRDGQSRATLVQRLRDPKSVVHNSHMPNFGFTEQQASSVADFLASVSKQPHDVSLVKLKSDDVSQGRKLLVSLGCAACHQLTADDQHSVPAAPYEGPELVNVGSRRSAAWLHRWLRTPESVNADHRMPVFQFSSDERRQLVAALTSGAAESEHSIKTSELDAGRVAAGKKLVREAGCAACHKVPGIQSLPLPPLTSASSENSGTHCLAAHQEADRGEASAGRVPGYALARADVEAVQAWMATLQNSSPMGVAATGRILLDRKGCLACHDRDLNRGLSSIAATLQTLHPQLAGRSQSLIPPSLTAVGDKLNDDYLRTAVAGEQKKRRLPWLAVRMPKYVHSDKERAAIVHHLVSTDRIPDAADAARQDILAAADLHGTAKSTAEELVLGNHLTGARGFNCVACHTAGPFEPRNVAPGTRGSDIMTMGARIRPRFFHRWMKNPIRVVRGIEMPAIKKGVPNLLDGSLPAQIGVVWKALGDSRFTPPTVTSRFEQVVNVSSDQPPRIIRDVFTIGLDKDRIPVARAMAIGFSNGHNLLVDLDTMQIRQWTIGEFARQRTEGKSWYWDMPGTTVRSNEQFADTFEVTLDGRSFRPIEDESRLYELLSYRLRDEGVEVITRSWYDFSDESQPPAKTTEPHFTGTAWADSSRPLHPVVLRHEFLPARSAEDKSWAGWRHTISVSDVPEGLRLKSVSIPQGARDQKADIPQIMVRQTAEDWMPADARTESAHGLRITAFSKVAVPKLSSPPALPPVPASMDRVTTVPGFSGTRLPIRTDVMPTAMAWRPDGRMAFTSLKGHVWIAEDTNSDGVPDKTSLFEEGLAAPFGILADGDSLVVSHKPEILRLGDHNNDGRADVRGVVAAGWGFNDNYHDWTSGLIRDDEGNMYVGLGSDYSQKQRPTNQDRWRGGVIRIDPSGIITPLGMSMRYPMGLALDRHGNLFATDNQGVQNTFNEINHIRPGRHYGVPSAHQPTDDIQHEAPALMVPHPWTRSVNSILFLPDDFPVAALRGHGIGCEYDSRFLIRFTVQNVNGTLQGASYRFSRHDQEAGGSNFIGPICSAVAPDGSLFIGSIWDSGWQGGQNTGGITRLLPTAAGLPNGIREMTATADGFVIEFFKPVDVVAAKDPTSWSITGYTRKWGGSYATPDSGRYTLPPTDIETSDNGTRVHVSVKDLRPGFLYSVSAAGPLAESVEFWPSAAHYSMKVVPE